jgi:hypothetical protein
LPGAGEEPVLWHVHTLEGNYSLHLWRFEPQTPEMYATNAQYIINHKGGLTYKYIDWTAAENGWQMLGRFTFTDHWAQGVWLSDDADGYLIADAVKIISVSRMAVAEPVRKP